MPVILICTSGTATANYYPAVIEAETSRVPLIVLTGDRPPRLLDSGRSGRRSGDLVLDAVRYRWRLLPCPGHWLCVAVRG